MRRLLSAVLALLPGVASAQALDLPAEEVVRFLSQGQEVVATFARPDGPPAPVVLLLHGFTGSRDEAEVPATGEGIFERTAAALASAGYSSLRIDFRGSGESVADLSYAETTFESQVADGLAALDWLAAEPRVGTEVHVLGWSMGGAVATAVAGRYGGGSRLVLWNALARPEATMRGLLGDAMFEAGLAAGPDEPVGAGNPHGGGVTLNGAFFDSAVAYDPLAEIAAFPGPVLIVQGTRDAIVPPASADALAEAHAGEDRVVRLDMDHAFDVGRGPATLDAMLDETVRFLSGD